MTAIFVLLKTDSDVAVWIATALAVLLFLWLITEAVKWISSKPWQRLPASNINSMTLDGSASQATTQPDESDPPADEQIAVSPV